MNKIHRDNSHDDFFFSNLFTSSCLSKVIFTFETNSFNSIVSFHQYTPGCWTNHIEIGSNIVPHNPQKGIDYRKDDRSLFREQYRWAIR